MAVRAFDRDIDGGLQSAREILGVGRSVGDEPFFLPQLVRCSVQVTAADLIAFVLCQGDATESALAATQAALADEAEPPQLLIMLRGERTGDYDLCDKIAAGRINIKALYDQNPEEQKPDGIERPEYRASQAIVLHMLTMAVENAKKPTWQQVTLWDEWATRAAEFTKNPAGTCIVLPATNAAFPAFARARSLLTAAEAIIGLERIRITRNSWPKPGDSVLPVSRKVYPLDPYSGSPLMWKATGLELLVYSVGGDLTDNGGRLDDSLPSWHGPWLPHQEKR